MSTNPQHTHTVHQDWMGKAWDVGTFPFLGGIPVSVHYAWPLFAGVFLISGTVSYWKVLKGTAILYSLLHLAFLWCTVFIHELGHSWMAKREGGTVDKIMLWPLGGLAYCCPGNSAWSDLKMAAAGPLTHLPLITFLGIIIGAKGYGPFLTSRLLPDENTFGALVLIDLFSMQVLLMFFNLLPMFPLDGGRILLDVLIIKKVPLKKAANITVISCSVVLTSWFGWVIYRWIEGFSPWFSLIVGAWIGYNCYQLYQASQTDETLRTHPLMSGYARWGLGGASSGSGGSGLHHDLVDNDTSALYAPGDDNNDFNILQDTPNKTTNWFGGGPKGTPAPAALSSAGSWGVPPSSQAHSNAEFQKVQKGGKVGGQEAWKLYASCGLPTATLSSIWKLSDVDGDQFLDVEEFALMAYLITSAQEGHPVPTSLPANLIPPSHR